MDGEEVNIYESPEGYAAEVISSLFSSSKTCPSGQASVFAWRSHEREQVRCYEHLWEVAVQTVREHSSYSVPHEAATQCTMIT
jgi:hypothetical protein